MTDREPPPPSQRALMCAGRPYRGDDPELVAERRAAAVLADRFLQLHLTDEAAAQAALAALLGSCGPATSVRPPLVVDYGWNLHVGARTFVNAGLTALDVAPIVIGDDCQIGPQVQLLTPTHPTDPSLRRTGLESGAPIAIGDNVWLGGGVIVCPGVTIGSDSVIGAGAVVVHDVPPRSLAVGNPARVVRAL